MIVYRFPFTIPCWKPGAGEISYNAIYLLVFPRVLFCRSHNITSFPSNSSGSSPCHSTVPMSLSRILVIYFSSTCDITSPSSIRCSKHISFVLVVRWYTSLPLFLSAHQHCPADFCCLFTDPQSFLFISRIVSLNRKIHPILQADFPCLTDEYYKTCRLSLLSPNSLYWLINKEAALISFCFTFTMFSSSFMLL